MTTTVDETQHETHKRVFENLIRECDSEIQELTEFNSVLEADDASANQPVRTLNEFQIERLKAHRNVLEVLKDRLARPLKTKRR